MKRSREEDGSVRPTGGTQIELGSRTVVVTDDGKFLRQMLDGDEVGPVVGRVREDDGSLEIDERKHGAWDFVGELLGSKLLRNVEGSTLSDAPVSSLNRSEFEKNGIVCVNDAFTAEETKVLRQHLLRKEVRRDGHGQDYCVRSDKIAFVRLLFDEEEEADEDLDEEEEEVEEALRQGFLKLSRIGAQFETCLDTKLRCPPEGMVAIYPGQQSKYVEHLDNQFKEKTSSWINYRVLTIILYLNEDDWGPNDGGELQYKVGEDKVKQPPTGGTVVVFNSRTLLHEVLPTSRNRYAMTLWLVSNDITC